MLNITLRESIPEEKGYHQIKKSILLLPGLELNACLVFFFWLASRNYS